MAKKKAIPLKEEIYHLEKLDDDSFRIGNSEEVSVDEAILMIKNLQAKSALAPIGELPSHLLIINVDEGEE